MNQSHSDEYWQSIEPAYNLVYGGVTLPWEWDPQYRLRSTFYPMYLALPLYILKTLGLDYPWVVRLCPQYAHILLVLVCDRYLWKIGKCTVGKNASRIAMLIYFISRQQSEILIRCFSNSVETVLTVIAFYYFLQVKSKFDKNVVLMVAAMTVSFIVRNTSPIGWPLLLLIKVVKDRSFLPFLFAGVTVFVPIMCLATFIDSWYYGFKEHFPVITALTFLNINLGKSLSNYFGTDPIQFYLTFALPTYFAVAIPFVYMSWFVYLKDMLLTSKRIPYLLIIIGSYLAIYSLIPHKEVRFILPTIPFCILILAYFISKQVKETRALKPNKIKRKLVTLILGLYILVEILIGIFYLVRFPLWQGAVYLQFKDHAPHSVYTLFNDAPYFTHSHK